MHLGPRHVDVFVVNVLVLVVYVLKQKFTSHIRVERECSDRDSRQREVARLRLALNFLSCKLTWWSIIKTTGGAQRPRLAEVARGR